MFVLGTAGHVDHGKSSLLKALTGEEPDRLPEEKLRGMTIDLNFHSLKLKSGVRVGVVDVPGHERFVKNMISGVTGMDAFLFVVAADDGWMPQSEEHLRVLKALGVTRGIAVITKSDLVSESDRKIVAAMVGTKLKEAFSEVIPTFSFSNVENSEAEALEILHAITTLVASLPKPLDSGTARLWVDRVFVPKGMGVVVTGTLREGVLKEGDSVTIAISGKIALVKSIQCYHESVEKAFPVSRVALQLSRIQKDDVSRGSLLEGKPSSASVTQFDGSAELLVVATRAVRVSVHLGTAKFHAVLIPLGAKREKRGFFRFKMEHPIPIRSGEPFILRTSGDEKLVGWGRAIDVAPTKGPHRAAESWLTQWNASTLGMIDFLWAKEKVVKKESFSSSLFHWNEALASMKASWWIDTKDSFAIGKQALEGWLKDLSQSRNYSQSGLSALWRKRFGGTPSLVTAVLPYWIQAGGLKKEGENYVNPTVAVLKAPQEETIDQKILEALSKEGANPTNFGELMKQPTLRTSLSRLVKEGSIVALAEDHYLSKKTYDAYCQKVEGYLKQKGSASTSELKTYLNLSRKHVVFVLERLDKDRLTYLKEGVRKLLKG